MKLKKGMILSAGFGKRMMPTTKIIPKPLIKIGQTTLLENSILILKKFGIQDIIINAHHLSKEIENYIKNKTFHTNIKLVIEEKAILDTGGGILNATDEFGNEPFIVINPDTIWSNSHLKEFENLEKIYFDKNIATLLLVNKNRSFDKSFKGDFNIDKHGLVSRDKTNKMIFTGAQIINRNIFKNHIIEPFSMNIIWDELIAKNSLAGIESHQEFLHINTIETYKKLISTRFTH